MCSRVTPLAVAWAGITILSASGVLSQPGRASLNLGSEPRSASDSWIPAEIRDEPSSYFKCSAPKVFGEQAVAHSFEAQGDSLTWRPIRFAITPFVEVRGLGGYASVNLDLTLRTQTRAQPHFRIGYWDDRWARSRRNYYKLVALPVEVGYLIGRTHRLEVNLGYTYERPVDARAPEAHYRDFTTLVGWVGYRYQRPNGGLMVKAGLSRQLRPNKIGGLDVPSAEGPWWGFGIGYTIPPVR